MGVINGIFNLLFGNSRNVIRETAEVFRENTEAGAVREFDLRRATMEQFGQEFVLARSGWFDRFMDALNRVPRPAMALGTLGLFVSAMTDPIWFASRMQGIALVPEPLWWLLGAIISFYFGARHQAKGQAFQQSIAGSVALAGQVTGNIRALQALEGGAQSDPALPLTGEAAAAQPGANPALDDWRAANE